MFSDLLYTHSGYQSVREASLTSLHSLCLQPPCVQPPFYWLFFHISVSPKPEVLLWWLFCVAFSLTFIYINIYILQQHNKYCSLLLSHCAHALLHAGASAIINIEQFSSQAPLTRAINNSSCSSPGLSRLGS